MGYSDTLDVRITDSSLRDGSHAKAHQFTEAHVAAVVDGLASAGVPVVEVSHGDGLAGSSFNYGFPAVDERRLMQAAVEAAAGRTAIAALMLPGVGTMDDIRAWLKDNQDSMCAAMHEAINAEWNRRDDG